MVLDWFGNLFSPILNPLLLLEPIYILLIVSFGVAIIFTLIYKFATDQNMIKSIKDEMKSLQSEMKKVRDQPEKFSEMQKTVMQKNMLIFKQTMKVNLITMIPILIIFGWLSTSLAYEPIMPGEVFTAELEFLDGFEGDVILNPGNLITSSNLSKTISAGKVSWALSGEEGMHRLEFNYTGNIYEKKVLITNERKYEQPVSIINSKVKQITVSNRELKPLGDFSLFGWYPGWLGTYFFLAIISSLLVRKLLKVH